MSKVNGNELVVECSPSVLGLGEEGQLTFKITNPSKQNIDERSLAFLMPCGDNESALSLNEESISLLRCSEGWSLTPLLKEDGTAESEDEKVKTFLFSYGGKKSPFPAGEGTEFVFKINPVSTVRGTAKIQLAIQKKRTEISIKKGAAEMYMKNFIACKSKDQTYPDTVFENGHDIYLRWNGNATHYEVFGADVSELTSNSSGDTLRVIKGGLTQTTNLVLKGVMVDGESEDEMYLNLCIVIENPDIKAESAKISGTIESKKVKTRTAQIESTVSSKEIKADSSKIERMTSERINSEDAIIKDYFCASKTLKCLETFELNKVELKKVVSGRINSDGEIVSGTRLYAGSSKKAYYPFKVEKTKSYMEIDGKKEEVIIKYTLKFETTKWLNVVVTSVDEEGDPYMSMSRAKLPVVNYLSKNSVEIYFKIGFNDYFGYKKPFGFTFIMIGE